MKSTIYFGFQPLNTPISCRPKVKWMWTEAEDAQCNFDLQRIEANKGQRGSQNVSFNLKKTDSDVEPTLVRSKLG